MYLVNFSLCLMAVNINAIGYGVVRGGREVILHFLGRTISDPNYLRSAEALNYIQKPISRSVDFPCVDYVKDYSRSKKRPTSVHALRPGDIDIIVGLGDSLTVGNGAGATKFYQFFVENRGVAPSIGGEGTWRKYLTVPNILKKFNPKIFGYSFRDGLGFHKSSQFNLGEPGASSEDLPYMAKQFVNRIKKDRRVNMKKHWKLVTLMLGGNNFCSDMCYHDDYPEYLKKHRRELYAALRTIKDNVPRVLLNYIPPGDASLTVFNTETRPLKCDLMMKFECPCFFGLAHKSKYEAMQKAIKEWMKIDMEVVNLPEFYDSDDFTIVIQPFSADLRMPKNKDNTSDLTYLSGSDCFHFSQKGYARIAQGLWNNMLQPVGSKTIGITDEFICPTPENPYIFTNENSNVDFNRTKHTQYFKI